MQRGASLLSNSISLNGGNIRNHNEVRMLGEHCETQMHGLYLMDKEQRIDNYVYVEHAFPNCTSNELFKGILDDSSRAAFNGHVLVCEHASKTDAVQSNKNILLTDKAIVDSKPFLEIYNDDVKCSHGSTIGQLDETALFYIRSRGISERTAKTLLMYAFCDEVIQKIEIKALADRLSDMVKKRLHGELTVCDECALHCSVPECKFEIDITKV
jgi:Fe-S cluster assembly protein SufD